MGFYSARAGSNFHNFLVAKITVCYLDSSAVEGFTAEGSQCVHHVHCVCVHGTRTGSMFAILGDSAKMQEVERD